MVSNPSPCNCVETARGRWYGRTMGRRFCYVASVWALLASACGSSTDNGGKPSDAQELPKAFAKSVCGSFARCCRHQSFELDLTECERRLEADLVQELAEYDGLQVRFDPNAAALCIADYANAACLEQPSEGYDVKRHCRVMFEGLIEPGGSCDDTDECRVEDGRRAQCSDGTCLLDSEPAPHGTAGAACGNTCKTSPDDDGACESAFAAFNDPAPDPTLPTCFTSDGLQCAGKAGERTCQPLVEEGGSCAGSSQGCAVGTFCEHETRICQAQTDSGPCGPEGNACTAKAACDFETSRCVLVGSRDGTRCEQDADCRSGYCNPSSVCQQPYSASSCSDPKLN